MNHTLVYWFSGEENDKPVVIPTSQSPLDQRKSQKP